MKKIITDGDDDANICDNLVCTAGKSEQNVLLQLVQTNVNIHHIYHIIGHHPTNDNYYNMNELRMSR